MPKNEQPPAAPESPLSDRVVTILEQARGNVVRSVNSEMVIACRLVGWEIAEEEQQGEKHAEYGKRLIEELSGKLTERYEKGFFASKLWNFRPFYLSYVDRPPKILDPVGRDPRPMAKRATPRGIPNIACRYA